MILSAIMGESAPTVLIPGLAGTARLYAAQLPLLWRFGPLMLADHRRDDHIAAIARRILAQAPPRFALLGLSMGGYIAFEILRQAPERVLKLALLDTTARPDSAEQRLQRREQIELAQSGRYPQVTELAFPGLVHPERSADPTLRAIVRCMAEETGPEAFVRQQTAIMSRPDSRPDLPSIACPPVVLVGDADPLKPRARAEEMAAAIPGARLVVVPGSGHLSTLEQPEAVSATLAQWLADPARDAP